MWLCQKRKGTALLWATPRRRTTLAACARTLVHRAISPTGGAPVYPADTLSCVVHSRYAADLVAGALPVLSQITAETMIN